MSDVHFTLCFKESFFGILFLWPKRKVMLSVWGEKIGKNQKSGNACVWVVRCFARLIFLQPVKDTIRRCFTGMTRGWKGDTGRKASKNQWKNPQNQGNATKLMNNTFTLSNINWFWGLSFFPLCGKKLNFIHENVDGYLKFDFRAAYVNIDLHYILSGAEGREEEIWMWVLAVVPFLQLLLPFIKGQLGIHALLLCNVYIILKSWAVQFFSFSEMLSYISSTLL